MRWTRSPGRWLRPARSTHSTGSQWSARSIDSLLSFASLYSIASAVSVASIGSAGSILSIGSTGSILSIGSAGSILSIGAVGSIGSIGRAGNNTLRRGASSSANEGADERPPRFTIERGATLLGMAALLAAVAA